MKTLVKVTIGKETKELEVEITEYAYYKGFSVKANMVTTNGKKVHRGNVTFIYEEGKTEYDLSKDKAEMMYSGMRGNGGFTKSSQFRSVYF